MTSEIADDIHRQSMLATLHELNAPIKNILPASDQVQSNAKNCEYWDVTHKGARLLMSSGCSVSVHSGRIKNEFVIGCNNEAYDCLMLFENAIFFHLTYRHVEYADCLEIGGVRHGRYTDIFVSVPFFFPPELNFQDIGGYKYNLLWLMPITSEEAKFLREHGSDAFEDRLVASGYGYFEDRTDMSYLSRT